MFKNLDENQWKNFQLKKFNNNREKKHVLGHKY